MKIAFLRGPHLNPWELQSYGPLAKSNTFSAIGADWQFYRKPIEVPGIQIQRVHVWGASLDRWHPQAPVWFNRALSWTTGRSYGLCGLEAAVGSADILHSAELYTTMTYQALQVKRRKGCRLVATVWENLPRMGETHPLRRRRKAEVIQAIDGVLAVTETTRRMLIAEGVAADRIQVIYPAIDTVRFQPGAKNPALLQRWGLTAGDFIILFIGRLVPEKGLHELIEAIPHVMQNSSPRRIRFLIVGAGPLTPDVDRARVQTNGAIIHCPFVSYEEIPALHQLADVFVLPSKALPKWQEQFGYVLVESMASGKAVVTTRSGSISDVVGDAAVLIPPGDAGSLADAILTLIRNPERLQILAEKAKRRIHEYFQVSAISHQLDAFYRDVLTKKAIS